MRKTDRTIAHFGPAIPGGQEVTGVDSFWPAQAMEVAQTFTICSGALLIFLTHDLGS
ncbi:MAG: hypothetical protein Q7K57_55300 [Burkholderiaceae bacterium]|nr:hypothetical protein [Burkholderiaceae bacterium]